MMGIWEYIKTAAIVIAAVLLAYKGLDMLVAKIGGPAKLEAARRLVNDVVYYVEQTVKAPGSEKKARAVEMARAGLKIVGIHLDDKTLGMLIEAAVFAMNLIIKKTELAAGERS